VSESKTKKERLARREVAGDQFAELRRWADDMRATAHRHSNYLWITKGERLATKIGTVQGVGGEWSPGKLKPVLATTLRLEGWPTHAVLTYTVDVVRDGKNRLDVRMVRHLSITMHVPILTSTPELRVIKDEYLARTFPRELLDLWFHDRESVVTAIRAGEPQRDESGETWTPVVAHFYADHQRDLTIGDDKPTLYDAGGNTIN
jgi:hypothetical protein